MFSSGSSATTLPQREVNSEPPSLGRSKALLFLGVPTATATAKNGGGRIALIGGRPPALNWLAPEAPYRPTKGRRRPATEDVHFAAAAA
jgi:hypothetical protein